jgi:hypothetical protein
MSFGTDPLLDVSSITSWPLSEAAVVRPGFPNVGSTAFVWVEGPLF